MKINYPLVALCLSLNISACSPVMEATRPDPVDIHKFVIGEARIKVLGDIGSPLATNKEDGKSCDIYKLYTKGPGAAGKGAIAAGEAVADVLTLGLTEIIFTPAEAATRNAKHTVVFCYSPDNKLVSVNESDTSISE